MATMILLAVEGKVTGNEPAMPERAMMFRGTTAAEATAWQEKVRRHLSEALFGGQLPKRIALKSKVAIVSEQENFVLKRVTYQSRSDRTNYALLALPRGVSKCPAIVALHGHESKWGEADIKAFGKGRHSDDFCAYFANRGYVVIFPAVLDHKLNTPGWPLIGNWIWDSIRAIDYLQTLSEVDSGRIGCVGLSTGGMLAMYTTALDERIRVTVAAGCFTTWKHITTGLKVPPHCDCGQSKIRAFRDKLDFCDVYALCAPRPLMLIHGRQDVSLCPGADASKIDPKWQRAVMDTQEYDAALNETRRVYDTFEKDAALKMHFHLEGHKVDNAAAFEWIDSHLKSRNETSTKFTR